MTKTPEPPAQIAWDGHDIVAFAGPGAAGTRSVLVAETGSGASLLAAGEREDFAFARLPAGCRVATIFTRDAAGGLSETGVELDDMLVPGLVDPATPGLFRIDGRLPGVAEAEGLEGFGQSLTGIGGRRRLRIGPLVAASDSRRRTTFAVAADAARFRLRIAGVPERLFVAHFPAAAARSAVALSAIDGGVRADVEASINAFAAGVVPEGARDATGATPAEAFRRGFSLSAATSGEMVFNVAEGDEIALFADRGALLSAEGGDEASGSRAVFTIDAMAMQGGPVPAAISTRAYRPASATALAEIGGGRALSIAGKTGPVMAGRLLERAADLAAALWTRQRARAPSSTSPLSSLVPRGSPDGLSPLLDSIAGSLGLPLALAEELDAQTVETRLGFAFLALEEPSLARRAALARVRVSPGAPPDRDLGPAADWLLRSDTAALLARAASRLEGGTAGAPDRQQRRRLLDDLVNAAGGGWVDADRLIPGWKSFGAVTDTELRVAVLIANLAADPVRLSEAQRAAARVDLGELARLRAELPTRAGLDSELAAELARDLPSLPPRDVLLLDAHFSRETAERNAIAAMGAALTALEQAAGAVGLAAAQHRGGDAMLGMSHLASVTEPALRMLLKLPAAHTAVRGLNAWLSAAVPPPATDARAAPLLRRNLQVFAFYLLYRNVVAEAAAAAAGEGGASLSPARRALLSRLRGGLVETLPKVVAASEALHGERPLGLGFIERLNATSLSAAS
jgi:hypothetical protein